jgi:hypothetical protein
MEEAAALWSWCDGTNGCSCWVVIEELCRHLTDIIEGEVVLSKDFLVDDVALDQSAILDVDQENLWVSSWADKASFQWNWVEDRVDDWLAELLEVVGCWSQWDLKQAVIQFRVLDPAESSIKE